MMQLVAVFTDIIQKQMMMVMLELEQLLAIQQQITLD